MPDGGLFTGPALLSATIFGTSVTVGQVALVAALSGASYLLNQAQNAPTSAGSADQTVQQTLQEPIYDERLIYGRCMVGGRLFFYEVKPPWLFLGLELASHEIDGIDQILVNGVPVTFDANGAASSSNFLRGGVCYLYMSLRKGGAGQVIDPILASNFSELPASFKQQGHACVVMQCYYGADATDHNTVWGGGLYPEFLFLARGAKVFDPRDATQSLAAPASWKWRDNAALCQTHFATFARGHATPWAFLDMATITAAANVCDQTITMASGAVERRYTVNGAINPNTAPGGNLQQLLAASLGDFIWSNGVYKLYAAEPKTAVWTLNDDSARGDMELRVTRDRQGLINSVRTLFVAPDRAYQTANGPILTNAAYQALDGAAHEMTLDLPFTNSATMAQRLAKAVMEKSRSGKTITRRESIDAIRLESADVVNIEVNSLPALGGVFRILKNTFDHDTHEVMIEAEEYNPNWLAWSVADEQPFTFNPAQLSGTR